MTVLIGFVANPLDPAQWLEISTDDPREALRDHFGTWPASARIYDLEGVGDWRRAGALADPAILAARDATPRDQQGVDRLGQLRGPLLVVIPPADPVTAIIAIAAVAIGVAAAFLFLPKIPGAQSQPSPNNALADRSNVARPNGRITDIYGTVEATPDLIAVPYTIYESNREIEISFMGVGRGAYAVSRVRDGTTSIASIAGASAAIYAPGTSPNSGDAPQLQIGPAIAEPVKSVIKVNEVNGQTLRATNINFAQGQDSIRFVSPDLIESTDSNIDFTDNFQVGDAITVANAAIDGTGGVAAISENALFNFAGEIEFDTYDPTALFATGQFITASLAGYAGATDAGGILYVDLSGTYEIASVSTTKIVLVDPDLVNADWLNLDQYVGDQTEFRAVSFSRAIAAEGINLNGNYTIAALSSNSITLNNPVLVNSDWGDLAGLPGGATAYVSPLISRNSQSWEGPFIVDLDDCEQILANITAANGLFTVSKKGQQVAVQVGITLEATPINENDAAIGPAETFSATMIGSNTEKTTVGYSLYANPTFQGRASVRMRRTSPSPKEADFGQILDEIKWRDCFGLAPVAQTDFGDITTVMTRTIATASALSVKSRKLNMRVTRKVPTLISATEFGPATAQNSAAAILCAMALDPYIGRREISEVDVGQIYQTVADVEDYFGSPLAAKFGYSFDDVNLSFQESAQIVAKAIFSTAYRQGRVLKLAFERATEESTLLFNARNTLPGTQKRSIRFGAIDDHDGVDLDYVAARDGAPMTYVIPLDGSALSPRSLEILGVRSAEQAYWHTWRAWNKVRYQNLICELEATQEGALVIPNDRVLIADMTRPDILQGEVEGLIGTTLLLSDEANLLPLIDWTIFLQHQDGTVEALRASAWIPPVGQPEDLHKIELASLPRATLSTDGANFARATYMIAPLDDVQSRAFIVVEREPEGNFTETIRAANYTFLYYQNDELALGLDLSDSSLRDSSPYRRDGLATGGGLIAPDSERTIAYQAAGGVSRIQFPAFAPPASYTKSAWLRLDDGTTTAILGNEHEIFVIESGFLIGGHAGYAVDTPWPGPLAWHHVALTYDLADQHMALYLDGVLADQATGIASRTLGQLLGLSGLKGRADDLRLWRRALSATEIGQIYRATKKATPRLAGLLTPAGQRIIAESRDRIILE